jgi:flagellin-like hook-associated protein FlgL
MAKSMEKLSSGYRINTGMDAPADLVISEQLRSQISGINRAIRNTTESINVLTIAEGALNEMNNILKKMRALAIHAANSGITSPEQIAADQSEMDSGIQTLERISGTTQFSDQHLINGQKQIAYSSTVNVKSTQNNRLINENLSDFVQVFKRQGYTVSFVFNGAAPTNTLGCASIADASMKNQAAKAYLEVNPIEGTKSQIGTDGRLTRAQSFILTGNLGSRQFDFSLGAHVTDIVTSINNLRGSTGVSAALTFNSEQVINRSVQDLDWDNLTAGVGSYSGIASDANNAIIYDNYRLAANGQYVPIATGFNASADFSEVVYGLNTDGLGNIYAKAVLNGNGLMSWEYYKDVSLSTESLVGTGSLDGSVFTPRNNSFLSHIGLEMASDARHGDVVKINFGNVRLDHALNGNVTAVGVGSRPVDLDKSTAAGVQLGLNTDQTGKIYIKMEWGDSGTVTAYAYKDGLMRPEDMVAKTMAPVTISGAPGSNTILLDSIWNDEHSFSTGISLALAIPGDPAETDPTSDLYLPINTTESFDIEFNHLGARIYASEYGSQQFLQVQQMTGGLFTHYESPTNFDSTKLIEAGTTFRLAGQDAVVNVNGKKMYTNGLQLDLATQDIMATIEFRSGHTGTTTLAQVGYGEGSIFSKCGALTVSTVADSLRVTGINAMLNQANHNTIQIIDDFSGGIQLQLGEGEGDQNRTIVGIKSMATTNLGRIEITGVFSKDNPVIETRMISIQDIMGGQVASLATDPVIAMRVIEKAISDVSATRAVIGAVQANMLQTNENNLRVAVENITKTESNIRDTDMAAEMTEFTKNQVLSNAGIAMTTQANTQAQNVLQLLR